MREREKNNNTVLKAQILLDILRVVGVCLLTESFERKQKQQQHFYPYVRHAATVVSVASGVKGFIENKKVWHLQYVKFAINTSHDLVEHKFRIFEFSVFIRFI